MKLIKLSIIIPVYNEEATVEGLINLVLEACTQLPKKISDFELIIVEDGSSDGTIKVLKNHFENHEKVHLFYQDYN
ncbi:MAG: glycosyltransferase [Bacteriovoracaceae bacterium]|nr:glycosyltransferase [Bacteriovoracaceae bacterium]